LDVEVAVNNVVISPDEYTVDYGDSSTAAVTFDTAPASGAVIVVLESDPITGLELRIFQDMRGVQATYRMTPATTTTLTQNLYTNSDIVYVDDAGALAEPDLDNNIWGVLTVNGERIMYRERDLVTNTVSSLLRGTAGTAATDHLIPVTWNIANSYVNGQIVNDSDVFYTAIQNVPSSEAVPISDTEYWALTISPILVYNLNRDNLAPVIYQDRIVGSDTLANGTTTIFTADVDLSLEDSTFDQQAVLVYVGGLLQTSGYAVTGDNPVTIEFDTAPTAGYQVTIQIRQGLGWYGAGSTTAYDGIGLQYTDTLAAQFFRG
jgi:hypothetical protein